MNPFQWVVEELGYIDERVRTRAFAGTAGLAFAYAWWLFIDAALMAIHHDTLVVPPHLYLPGVGATLGFIIVSLMDLRSLQGDDYGYDSPLAKYQARALFGTGILLMLVCFICACIAASEVYFKRKGVNHIIPDSTYPGEAMIVQTILIPTAAVLMRLARSTED